jgi:hypothetical protein
MLNNMIKKSKEGFKEIANQINEAISSNSKTIVIPISKGLWGIGSIAIRDNVCGEMNIKPWDSKFSCNVNENNGRYELIITIKNE